MNDADNAAPAEACADSAAFRILALDGGGVKGAFTAQLLASWEEDTKLRIVDHFDLIAGTSTGGIIALGLGLGLPASDIVEFYVKHGPSIFPNEGPIQRKLLGMGHFFRSKYSQAPLRAALAAVFGDRKLGEAKTRLLLTSYDATAGRIFVMKTAHHERFKYDYNNPAVDVALATSAAPTFFDPAVLPGYKGTTYVDGGVWANNPTLAAIIEARSFLGVAFERMDVLSVGTTQETSQLIAQLSRGPLSWVAPGVLRWAPHLLGLMFAAQMQSSEAMARLLTYDRVLRVNKQVDHNWVSLDSADKIQDLLALGRGKAVEKEVLAQVKSRFLNGVPVRPFSPCYAVSSTPASESSAL